MDTYSEKQDSDYSINTNKPSFSMKQNIDHKLTSTNKMSIGIAAIN